MLTPGASYFDKSEGSIAPTPLELPSALGAADDEDDEDEDVEEEEGEEEEEEEGGSHEVLPPEQGWDLARRLRGGFAEWIEHDEPIQEATPPEGGSYKVGDPVQLSDGRRGWIITAPSADAYEVYLEDGTTAGPLNEVELGK